MCVSQNNLHVIYIVFTSYLEQSIAALSKFLALSGVHVCKSPKVDLFSYLENSSLGCTSQITLTGTVCSYNTKGKAVTLYLANPGLSLDIA